MNYLEKLSRLLRLTQNTVSNRERRRKNDASIRTEDFVRKVLHVSLSTAMKFVVSTRRLDPSPRKEYVYSDIQTSASNGQMDSAGEVLTVYISTILMTIILQRKTNKNMSNMKVMILLMKMSMKVQVKLTKTIMKCVKQMTDFMKMTMTPTK